MKIFITGVAGFLGSHLADRMLELSGNVSKREMTSQILDNMDIEVKRIVSYYDSTSEVGSPEYGYIGKLKI